MRADSTLRKKSSWSSLVAPFLARCHSEGSKQTDLVGDQTNRTHGSSAMEVGTSGISGTAENTREREDRGRRSTFAKHLIGVGCCFFILEEPFTSLGLNSHSVVLVTLFMQV